ncbi:MotA/TolQ/ExbB proton channel family protein [Luteolibacter sp. SL250]|uniref:MotA/TolQ/ExbB proton channel family protein n=1 Tax=Luteolibacter sp. SL250 TaxID=2995170 RepID=UPI0022712FC9|nr:MotA/TolQ/ExbB proton channel family protein [Luteolibacter sp. SL250]WAC20685.1 MotA/TolQ/ExbB proton channel family protein [Luteolibacter sp. SL250]
MEAPPSVAVVHVDPVWRKKRSFWIWNIVISSILMIFSPVAAMMATMVGMKGAFGALGTSGADVGALGDHIGNVMVATTIGLGISAIMFIWMVVAIIRLCVLPAPVEATP